MLIRVVIETNLGTVIAICDSDDRILLFDEEDAGGPAATVDKPPSLEVLNVDSFIDFICAWLKAYDAKVLVRSMVYEALIVDRDLPEAMQ